MITRRALLCGGPLLAARAGNSLPDLPRPIAGQFVGIHRGRLIVAGGTYWTKPKWEGGEKLWSTAIYTLAPGDTAWKHSGEQQVPLAYGGAVTTAQGLLCIGGQSPKSASPRVELLSWDGSRIRSRLFAELPEPRMLLAAAGEGGLIVAAGGSDSATAVAASPNAWMLQLQSGARWMELPPMPGPGRILPSMAATQGAFLLAGGAALSERGRTYLKSAMAFQIGWRPLPDLPVTLAAAPACCDAKGRMLLLGGDDGSLSPDLGAAHPGFRKKILRLDDRGWREQGELPAGLVTSGAVRYRNSIIVPGGEPQPGTRSARVISISS